MSSWFRYLAESVQDAPRLPRPDSFLTLGSLLGNLLCFLLVMVDDQQEGLQGRHDQVDGQGEKSNPPEAPRLLQNALSITGHVVLYHVSGKRAALRHSAVIFADGHQQQPK